MKTITIPITLPEDVAEQAERKGLLNPTSVVMLFCEALKAAPGALPEPVEYPLDFDLRLKKLVDPRQYRKGKILGNIIEPLDTALEYDCPLATVDDRLLRLSVLRTIK